MSLRLCNLSAAYQNDKNRRMRSISQRILLIDVEIHKQVYNHTHVICKILGSTNKMYTIDIFYNYNYAEIDLGSESAESDLNAESELDGYDNEYAYNEYTYNEYTYNEYAYNEYTDFTNTDRGEVNVYCSCPDFQHRNTICKHIYWFGIKKIGIFNPRHWRPRDISIFIQNHLYVYHMYPTGRNDTCPICLEKIDYQDEDEFTICCVNSCNNSVHVACWQRYYNISYSNECVMCRAPGMPTT